QYNRKKFRYKNTLAFVIGYAIGYVIFSFFVGLINFLYDLIKTKLGFGENYENYLHYVVKDAFSLPSMMFIGILALLVVFFSLSWYLIHGKIEAVAVDHSVINYFTDAIKQLSLEELFTQYEVVPDAGAVSESIEATSIVSHGLIINSPQLKQFQLVER